VLRGEAHKGEKRKTGGKEKKGKEGSPARRITVLCRSPVRDPGEIEGKKKRPAA